MNELRRLIRERSPLPPGETETLIATRFDHVPRRLGVALKRWPLDRASVLDVGCSYGMCLVHFGVGSRGVDNARNAVDFVRALGFEAEHADAEESLDSIPNGRYEFVWVSDILEHVDAPRMLLRRLAEKLRPEGRLLVQSSVLPRARLAAAMLRRVGEHPFDAEVHFHQWTLPTLRHLVTRSGYRVEHVVPLLPVPASMSSRVIVQAAPDGRIQERVSAAERRNRRPA